MPAQKKLTHNDFSSGTHNTRRTRDLFFAMYLSLAAGALIFAIKIHAYYITNSAAILSDAAESVVHLLAVGFAAYSLWLSQKPADRGHLYGHDRINFFSAGFEGAMIIIAALFIFYESLKKLLYGGSITHIEYGAGYIALAALINGGLGLFILRRGQRLHSIVLEANGRHVLTDCFTSIGVLVGLLLTKTTGWLLFDPLLALVIALHILWSGAGLIRRSVGGLMDSADPQVDVTLRQILGTETQKHGISYHFLRHRNAGNRLIIDFHLQFDNTTVIAVAHRQATEIEQEICRAFDMPAEVTSHFEPVDGHDEAHKPPQTQPK
ncbi:cation diffusion facilitator family transporter [Candidatus Persebacteraceae bacterium Df01]|uniref:Cation diffusion facilitator family transporter n=1 Tax=Candidatus Doriopsillibacter californiensis TaxID=2970740 RepID=A0ABT7QME4_9GAMM|nr:cation diffusion facilitator family transporter [Candidatus Persebacteraceae bacterium Df01]